MSERATTVLAEGISVCPLLTETLPPAIHTNAYLLGTADLLIVDPGADDVKEQQKLISEVRALQQQGKRARAVFLTHHHNDHVAAAKVVADALGVGVFCHPLTARHLTFPVGALFEDGNEIVLGGPTPMRFRLLHTPGHAKGHLCLVDEGSRAAIVGDMVAGFGTILIDPPEGDMADYLAQLKRLQDLPVGTLYPAHGPPLEDGPAALEMYIQHRLMREERIKNALGTDPAGESLENIAARAYADSPGAQPFVAQRSALAHLLKLARDGTARQVSEERWCRNA